MNIFEIILISLSVAIDAFAVSIIKGLKLKEDYLKNILIIGITFGLFQMFMPFIGYYLGYNLDRFIYKYSYLLSFILLFYIGLSMILKKENNDNHKNILILGIATSIDAFSIGVAYSLGYGSYNHFITFFSMGIITFILSSGGVVIGKKFGNIFKSKTNAIGGITLIIIGFKLLIEHFL